MTARKMRYTGPLVMDHMLGGQVRLRSPQVEIDILVADYDIPELIRRLQKFASQPKRKAKAKRDPYASDSWLADAMYPTIKPKRKKGAKR